MAVARCGRRYLWGSDEPGRSRSLIPLFARQGLRALDRVEDAAGIVRELVEEAGGVLWRLCSTPSERT